MVMPLAPCFFSRAFCRQVHGRRGFERLARNARRPCFAVLLPAVGHRAGFVLVRVLSRRRSVPQRAHARSGCPSFRRPGRIPGPRTARILDSLKRRRHSSADRHLTGRRLCRPAGRRSGVRFSAHLGGGGHEVRHRSALLDRLEALHRLDQVLDFRGSHKADVGRLVAEESRPCRPGSRRCRRTGNRRRAPACRKWRPSAPPVPAVHLVDQVAVDAAGRLVLPRGSSWPAPRPWPARRRTRSPCSVRRARC